MLLTASILGALICLLWAFAIDKVEKIGPECCSRVIYVLFAAGATTPAVAAAIDWNAHDRSQGHKVRQGEGSFLTGVCFDVKRTAHKARMIDWGVTGLA